MSLSTDLANRFKEVTLEGRWVANTNFQLQLSDVDWKQATQKVDDLNSIAALTFHVYYYIAGVLNVLKGGELEIRDRYSFDMPPIDSETDWQNLKNQLLTNAEEFALEISQLTDEQLRQGFVKPEYGDYLRNIEGMIEHCYYHLGQVSLLKKLTSTTTNS